MSSYNRIVTKECNQDTNGTVKCEGCIKSFKANPLFSKSNLELIWNLNALMEAKNLNRNQETYEIQILGNLNSTLLNPIYQNLQFPLINVNLKFSFN